jgi:hypothetical protein
VPVEEPSTASQPDMTRSNHDVRYSPKSAQRLHGIYEHTP